MSVRPLLFGRAAIGAHSDDAAEHGRASPRRKRHPVNMLSKDEARNGGNRRPTSPDAADTLSTSAKTILGLHAVGVGSDDRVRRRNGQDCKAARG
jgi:hypothetical protein